MIKKIVLFAAWVPANAPDTNRWSKEYIEILTDDLGQDDKIIAVNPGCCPEFRKSLFLVPRVLKIIDVPQSQHIGSEASAYQVALGAAKDVLADYDVALFLHSKGVSHKFDELSPLITHFRNKLLAPDILDQMHYENPQSIYVVDAAPLPQSVSIQSVSHLLKTAGINATGVGLMITSTIYAVSTNVLIPALRGLPSTFFSCNLQADYGFDRWFFEATFSGLLTAHGADVSFVDCGFR